MQQAKLQDSQARNNDDAIRYTKLVSAPRDLRKPSLTPPIPGNVPADTLLKTKSEQ